MAESTSGKTWLKYGCFGCLGVIGLVLFAGFVVVGLAWMQAGSEEIDERVLTPTIPRASDEVSVEASSRRGVVTLEVTDAQLSIEPARPGEPLRVDARFDTNAYELIESVETLPDDVWSYRMTFQGTRSGLINTLKELLTDGGPEVTVFLPPDQPIELIVKVSGSGFEAEIGGLWLTAIDIDVEQGGGELAVSEPLREPTERIGIEVSMGGLDAESLGNASPRSLDVVSRMGGANLDLSGRWLEDAEIGIRCRMGGVNVELPRNVGMVGVPDHPDATLGPEMPTLVFVTEGSKKSINFDR